MAKKKTKPLIVDTDQSGEKTIKLTAGGKKARKGTGNVVSDFQPRIKEAGDIILAEEWNEIQDEIKDDIMNIVNAFEAMGDKSSTMLSSGIASHGIFVELGWNVKPHVTLSLSGSVDDSREQKNFICFPHDISSKGFRIFAQSQDGETDGIVNWMAIGVI